MLGLKCSSLTFLLHIYFHYTKNIFLKHQYNQILHLVEKVLRPLMPQDKVQIVVWYPLHPGPNVPFLHCFSDSSPNTSSL